jgi:hypothetical protein
MGPTNLYHNVPLTTFIFGFTCKNHTVSRKAIPPIITQTQFQENYSEFLRQDVLNNFKYQEATSILKNSNCSSLLRKRLGYPVIIVLIIYMKIINSIFLITNSELRDNKVVLF